jgi:hypothetical protein
VVEIVEETAGAVDAAADLDGVAVAVIGRRWVRIAAAGATCLRRNTLHRREIAIHVATRIAARTIAVLSELRNVAETVDLIAARARR